MNSLDYILDNFPPEVLALVTTADCMEYPANVTPKEGQEGPGMLIDNIMHRYDTLTDSGLKTPGIEASAHHNAPIEAWAAYKAAFAIYLKSAVLDKNKKYSLFWRQKPTVLLDPKKEKMVKVISRLIILPE